MHNNSLKKMWSENLALTLWSNLMLLDFDTTTPKILLLCSFWWDDWLRGGALANHTTSILSLNNATIAHFVVNGQWNERKMRQQVPPLLIPSILDTKFQFVQGIPDSAVWKHTLSGKFTCISAWEICRSKKDIVVLNSQIWHKYIPFKMSFLLWRAIRHKILTNEMLANFGVEPVQCYCCIKQGWDEVDHIYSRTFCSTYLEIFCRQLGY